MQMPMIMEQQLTSKVRGTAATALAHAQTNTGRTQFSSKPKWNIAMSTTTYLRSLQTNVTNTKLQKVIISLILKL